MSSSISLRSSVEASIRPDYPRRLYARSRDPLSKAMKTLHEKENNARLEDDLIRLWRAETDLPKALPGDLACTHSQKQKPRELNELTGFSESGGKGGIRTHGTV
ncbi:MAG TPA: hypothetical protein VNE00_01245 [Paraburkholderia sp.]|nr:hypothetical protein [Paraburkholderia sp.]